MDCQFLRKSKVTDSLIPVFTTCCPLTSVSHGELKYKLLLFQLKHRVCLYWHVESNLQMFVITYLYQKEKWHIIITSQIIWMTDLKLFCESVRKVSFFRLDKHVKLEPCHADNRLDFEWHHQLLKENKQISSLYNRKGCGHKIQKAKS